MDISLSQGILIEDYVNNIEPTLTRPLTLGGVERRPRRWDEAVNAAFIHEVEVRPPTAAERTSRMRAKAS